MISLDRCVEEYVYSSMYTPDTAWLQSTYEYVPVFVYGTEKYRFSDHDLIKHHACVGIGHTVKDHYVLYKSKDHEPIAICMPSHASRLRLRGELYVIPIPVLFELDKKFENLVYFQRRWVQIIHTLPEFKDRKNKPWFLSEAIIWEGFRSMWNERIGTGYLRLMPAITAHDERRFYQYLHMDDQPNFRAKEERKRVRQCL